MTTYRELPEEVLQIIFANLNNKDILNCQYTCRTWYLPAHISLLDEVQLTEPQQVKSFIASIDRNPDPSYLKAVKKLKIIDAGNDEEEVNRIYGLPFQIDGNKLISRFVNLRKVEIQDSLVVFDNFTEETCDRIRTNCRQLDTFSVRCYDEENFPKNFSEILYMLRSLITHIDVFDLYDLEDTSEVEEFLSSFPRLKSIVGHHEDILRFQGWLPIYVKSPNLTEIGVDCHWDDDKAFMERFLHSKSEKQREMIVKSLSEISKLNWKCSTNFNSLKFITKYLTGLTNIDVSCSCKDPFYSMALDVAFSINECKFSTYANGTFLSTYLPIMMKKVFHPLPPTSDKLPRRVLEYQILSSDSTTKDVGVFLTAKSSFKQSLQSIKVESIDGFDLFLDVPFVRDDAVEFWLNLSYQFDHYVDTEWYDKVFARIAVFNKITIDVPTSYRDSQPRYKLHAQYYRIHNLTLQASPDLKFQTLIDRCYFAFTSLERLSIFNHSGTWNENTNKFQLDLRRYSLEQLTLDLTPAKTKYLQKKELTDDAFIVVEISSSDEQYLCKIPLCRTKSATIVDESVWDSSTDYLAVYVKVDNVRQVTFCIYHDKCDIIIFNDEDLQKSFGNATCSTIELCQSV